MNAQTFRLLLLVFIISDLAAALIGMWYLLANRSRAYVIMDYVALLLGGLAYKRLSEILANPYRPHGIHFDPVYVGWILSGQIILSACIWLFVLFLIGYRGNR